MILDNLSFFYTVYFAYYGFADSNSLFCSGLFLCGDKSQKGFDENINNSILTVNLINLVNTKNSQLAFLSTCFTATMASLQLLDKEIYLASAFQLFGFPHIIASL